MYFAIEGVIGVGKTTLARLLQTHAIHLLPHRASDIAELLAAEVGGVAHHVG